MILQLRLIALLGAVLISDGWTPSLAADEDAGETLFSVKCGRCHSALRLATRFHGVNDINQVRQALDTRLFQHFLKNPDERHLIIEYLERLAREKL